MMKASAMTTKMVVASFIATVKQRRHYNHTGYKIIVFKFIAKRKQLWKKVLQILGTAGPLGRSINDATAISVKQRNNTLLKIAFLHKS